MVKVLKRDKSLEGFQSKKIVRACKGAGVPEEVATAIAKIIRKKVKDKKTVKSERIKTNVLSILKKSCAAIKNWQTYRKPTKKVKKKKK